MQIISIGNDIEEVKRFKRLLNSKPYLLKKIFTQYEWEYSESKVQSQTLAGIWCAKEAVVKSIYSIKAIEIRHVEIKHDQFGAPYVFKILNSNLMQNYNFNISISHSKKYATAVCIAQKTF